jgi:hypothetical protein
VDGFRCDVAPLVPLEFWLRAREEVAAVNPDCFWIAESVEPSFILENRSRGLGCHSDAEMFQAFDVCYDYDIFGIFKKYLEASIPLSAYTEKINAQEYIYADNYIKLRCLENHDQSRIKFSVPDETALRNWTAFNYFQKGLTMLYAGQEWENAVRPSLFEKDTIDRNTGQDLTPLLQALYKIKKDPVLADSTYTAIALVDTCGSCPAGSGDVVIGIHRAKNQRTADTSALVGIFSFKGWTGPVDLATALQQSVPDGSYANLIDGACFRIEGGRISLRGEPVIFKVGGEKMRPW